jgi:hypothetical protein
LNGGGGVSQFCRVVKANFSESPHPLINISFPKIVGERPLNIKKIIKIFSVPEKIFLNLILLKEFPYISTSDFHQLWLKIQVRQQKSFIVCVAYRPPDSQVSCVREELKPRCIEALLIGKQVVIMGDLNCNLLNPSCAEAKVLTDTFYELNMTQLVKDPTRITSHSRSLLDVIMISSPLIVKDSGVVDIYRYHRPLYGLLYTEIKGHQTLPHTLSREKSQAL